MSDDENNTGFSLKNLFTNPLTWLLGGYYAAETYLAPKMVSKYLTASAENVVQQTTEIRKAYEQGTLFIHTLSEMSFSQYADLGLKTGLVAGAAALGVVGITAGVHSIKKIASLSADGISSAYRSAKKGFNNIFRPDHEYDYTKRPKKEASSQNIYISDEVKEIAKKHLTANKSEQSKRFDLYDDLYKNNAEMLSVNIDDITKDQRKTIEHKTKAEFNTFYPGSYSLG